MKGYAKIRLSLAKFRSMQDLKSVVAPFPLLQDSILHGESEFEGRAKSTVQYVPLENMTDLAEAHHGLTGCMTCCVPPAQPS